VVRTNISGYEAVEDGLFSGGIDRFLCEIVREPLYNAEKVLCRGSFFASMHKKTACIISDRDAISLRCIGEERKNQNAAFEIIILGKDLSSTLLRQLESEGIPVMAAETVSDISSMITDGIKYSELRKLPVSVFIPLRLLRSRQPVGIDARYYCDEFWNIKMDERSRRMTLLEEKYNRIIDINSSVDIRNVGQEGSRAHLCVYDAGSICTPSSADLRSRAAVNPDTHTKERTLIIAISGCAGVVQEIVGSAKNVSLCRMDMFGQCNPVPKIERYRKIIIIGHGSEYVSEMLSEHISPRYMAKVYEPGEDKTHEITEIRRVLRELLSDDNPDNSYHIRIIKDRIAALGLRPAQFSYLMCEGCPYMEVIKKLTACYGDINIYEDIYCERRGTIVRSGITLATSAFTGRMVVTNRSNCHYSTDDVRYIDIKCDKQPSNL